MSNYGHANSAEDAATSNVNHVDNEGKQVMNVDGVNGTRVFIEYNKETAYSEGTMVSYTQGTGKNKKTHYYVFLQGFKEGSVTFASLVNADGSVKDAGKSIIVKVNPVIVE